MCGRADVNPIAKSCTRKLKCSDARCLRRKVGQRFMIERECCCPSAKACFERFQVEIVGNVQGSTGSLSFEYDSCKFSETFRNPELVEFTSSEPFPVTYNGPTPFQPVPIQHVTVIDQLIPNSPDFWTFWQNEYVEDESIVLNAALGTLPSPIPTDFVILNNQFISQLNNDEWTVYNGIFSLKDADNNVLTLSSATITITRV